MSISEHKLMAVLNNMASAHRQKVSAVDENQELEGVELARASINMGAMVNAEELIRIVESGLLDETPCTSK